MGGGAWRAGPWGEAAEAEWRGLDLNVPEMDPCRETSPRTPDNQRPSPELPGPQRTELEAGSVASADAWTAEEIKS